MSHLFPTTYAILHISLSHCWILTFHVLQEKNTNHPNSNPQVVKQESKAVSIDQELSLMDLVDISLRFAPASATRVVRGNTEVHISFVSTALRDIALPCLSFASDDLHVPPSQAKSHVAELTRLGLKIIHCQDRVFCWVNPLVACKLKNPLVACKLKHDTQAEIRTKKMEVEELTWGFEPTEMP